MESNQCNCRAGDLADEFMLRLFYFLGELCILSSLSLNESLIISSSAGAFAQRDARFFHVLQIYYLHIFLRLKCIRCISRADMICSIKILHELYLFIFRILDTRVASSRLCCFEWCVCVSCFALYFVFLAPHLALYLIHSMLHFITPVAASQVYVCLCLCIVMAALKQITCDRFDQEGCQYPWQLI
jgi:hypothetical protein